MKSSKKTKKRQAVRSVHLHLATPRRDIAFILLCLVLIGLLFYSQYVWLHKQRQFLPVAMDKTIDKEKIVAPTTIPIAPFVLTNGSRDKKEIALTFDADMNAGMRYQYLTGRVKSWYDPKIVDTLEKTHTKATFFLTGMWIELYPEETQKFALNPLFELANHSYDHPSFDGYCYGLKQIQDLADNEEVMKTQKLLASVANVQNHYFRFPGGCYSKNDVKIIHDLGLDIVHWDVVSGDAFNTNAIVIENNVIDRVQNGSIVIFHLNGPPNAPKTAESLPVIIETLKKRGFEFVKVSELLK